MSILQTYIHVCEKVSNMNASINSITQRSFVKFGIWLIVLILLATIVPIATAGGSVSGTVFRDYSNDGIRASNEPGIAGINVKGTDDLGNVVTTTTGSNGTYSLPFLPGSDARIEFTLPASLSYLYEGDHGADNRTTVQFVNIANGNVNGVDAAFYESSDYCGTTNPDIATTCFVIGPNNGPNANSTAVVGLPHNATGHDWNHSFNPPIKTSSYQGFQVANMAQVGATYGIAYQPTTDVMYVGAYHKRLAGYGPAGPDAIYMLDFSSRNKIGTIQLDALTGINNVAGSDVHDLTVDPQIGDIMDIGFNNQSYAAVGKRSLGDIEMSGDYQTLYVMNMFNRRIYAIDVSNGSANQASLLASWGTPSGCGGVAHRPMALGWRNGRLWVGSVCENASTAFVHSFDPDPNVANPSFTTEVSFSLQFNRQAADAKPDFRSDSSAEWNGWIDNPEFVPYNSSTVGEISYPQPLLSDIEFDGEDLILGFRDRFSDQHGTYTTFRYSHYSPFNGAFRSSVISAGDIIRACRSGNGYTVECASSGGLPNSGPSGVEYYEWDIWDDVNNWNPNSNYGAYHWETTQGGLVQLPGNASVVTTAMDPYRAWGGGILRLDNGSGAREGGSSATGGYTIFQESNPNINGRETFGKGSGLGDLEAVCGVPRLQIGNRVWIDENKDGVQDPGEDPIVGYNCIPICCRCHTRR